VAFSPDGRQLAAVGGVDHRRGDIRIWDVALGTVIHRLRGHTDVVFDVDYSPDGTRLATASDDRTIKLWDTQTGDEVLTLRGHTGGVICVAFSPDGRQIGSGSVDRTARIWSIDQVDATLRYQRQAALDLAAAEQAIAAGHPSAAIGLLDRAQRFGLNGPRVSTRRLVARLLAAAPDVANPAARAELAALDWPAIDATSAIELAMNLARVGKTELALVAITQATRYQPENADVWSAAGRLQAAAGDQAHAAGAFARAQQLQTDRTDTTVGRPASWFATGWWLAGPFANDLDTSEWPEAGAAPFQPTEADPVTDGATAGAKRWLAVAQDGDSYVNLTPYLPDDNPASVYATQLVYSAHDQTVTLLMGAEGLMRVWLEHEQVYNQSRPRSARRAADAVPLTLKQGWNRLLVKLVSEREQPGMYVMLSHRAVDLARARTEHGELAGVVEIWEQARPSERRELPLMALAAEAFARQGKWREAADVYRQLVERQPVRNRNWVLLAPLLVQTGDAAAYRQHCDALLASFAEARLPITLERTAKACLLMPMEPSHVQRPAELAARACTLGANHEFLAHFRLADGMAQFRAGQWPLACERLEQARQLDNNRDPYLAATAGFLLAMACHQRQLEADAQRYFDEATATVRQRMPRLEQGDLGPAWPDWLVCEIARQQAASMILATR
jgi:tetratricopeptide (TPR) repeat protein